MEHQQSIGEYLKDIGEETPEYHAFVDKFKPKKTTDDCYTPENIYTTVLDWVVEEYGIDRDNVVRPFWPGGDYESYDYPEGCTVVDNPPFSIISKICRNYQNAGIRFFLFAPYLSNFNTNIHGITHIICDADVTYENGACVNTSFVTNLSPGRIARTAPVLRQRIVAADNENKRAKTKQLPKYVYPPQVLTATMLGYLAKYGIEFQVGETETRFIRRLDSQKAAGKTIFGGGYLISEKAAAEKAAAEKAAAEKAAAKRWALSERELAIIDSLAI